MSYRKQAKNDGTFLGKYGLLPSIQGDFRHMSLNTLGGGVVRRQSVARAVAREKATRSIARVFFRASVRLAAVQSAT